VTEDIAKCLISVVDKDNSGTMQFPEFVLLMTDGEVDVAEFERQAALPKTLGQLEEENQELEKAESLLRRLRSAWKIGRDEEDEVAELSRKYPLFSKYLAFSKQMDHLSVYPPFMNGITLTICVAAVQVGIETELASPGSDHRQSSLAALDLIILGIFTFEIFVKMTSLERHPLRYFNDNWNKFDFFIVFACYLFQLPFMPSLTSIISMLRLLRLLRMLKLVKTFPELRIIIEALISGFGSIFFVTIILFIFFYLYANIGMILFSVNDPAHFGNLQSALITAFGLSTLDGWSDLMYVFVTTFSNKK
jgi:hypothetical protein